MTQSYMQSHVGEAFIKASFRRLPWGSGVVTDSSPVLPLATKPKARTEQPVIPTAKVMARGFRNKRGASVQATTEGIVLVQIIVGEKVSSCSDKFQLVRLEEGLAACLTYVLWPYANPKP